MDCIVEDSVVLLCKTGIYKAVVLQRKRTLSFDRLTFLPDAAIGRPYGTKYQIINGQLVHLDYVPEPLLSLSDSQGMNKDNKEILDDGTAQKLSHKDIHDMKNQGLSGQTILQSVVQGSSSFKERTTFSQEKYIKKKAKIHIPVITILKPSTRLLCQMYYAKSPSRICHLRLDTISQMLTFGNVHANCNVVVMETCQGLLIGAILERLGGHGKVIQVFFGDRPVRTVLESFGHLSSQDKSILLQYPVHRLASLLKRHNNGDVCPPVSTPEENVCSIPEVVPQDVTMSGIPDSLEMKCPVTTTSVITTDLDCDDSPTKEGEEIMEVEDEEEERSAKRLKLQENDDEQGNGNYSDKQTDDIDEAKERKKKLREEEYEAAANVLLTTSMDCLFIASRFHPEPILMSLLPFLSPSRPFVVYCQFQEPLVQCYQRLRESGKVFNIQLTESWMRHYQVLSGRTHPDVNMDAQSGYLLFGTTTKT